MNADTTLININKYTVSSPVAGIFFILSVFFVSFDSSVDAAFAFEAAISPLSGFNVLTSSVLILHYYLQYLFPLVFLLI